MTTSGNEQIADNDVVEFEVDTDFDSVAPQPLATEAEPAPLAPPAVPLEDDSLQQLRRILVGPSKDEIDSKIEEMMVILDEREASIMRQQSDLRETVSHIEETLNQAMAEARSDHTRAIESIGTAITSLGEEITKLAQKD